MTTKKKEPDILFFDIETTPTIFAGWRLGKTNLTHDQVLKNPEVLCISWAVNNGKVKHLSLDLAKYDWYAKDDAADFEMLAEFIDVVNDTDLHVTQNGQNFDIPFLRSRLVKYKLPDIAPISMDDTYLSSKGIGFLSHKLDYLGDYLGHGGKEEHGNGMDWWIKVMRGDATILAKMVYYCDGDVVRTRKVYKDLLPYIHTSLNRSVFQGKPDVCPECGSANLKIHDRNRQTKTSVNTQWKCKDCGHYVTDGINLRSKKYTGVTVSTFKR